MKRTALTFEEAFETEVRPVIARVEEKTGEDFMSWYQPIRGEFVSEFTDIRWVAVQMLLYWANDTGTDFQTCACKFMKSFREEVQRKDFHLPTCLCSRCFEERCSRVEKK